MNRLSKRQLDIVEFAAKVYHNGLRHQGINGNLYENKLIQFLREDIPEFDFYRGQIKNKNSRSNQYDIIICKKGTDQLDFLKTVDSFVNIVDKTKCLGVIELKKWANPKMIDDKGSIANAYKKFKRDFPNLSYLFVSLRFKNKKTQKGGNWEELSKKLVTDGSFCFFGNTYHADKEWEFPWIENQKLIDKNLSYLGEYERLINKIKTLGNE